MLSGDFINHVDWFYTVDGHVTALRNVSALIRHFFPNTPTYWSIGNHEGVPVNSFLYLNQSDPDGTMSWLVLELFKAELSGESVHILSHIPPGDSECLEGWARNYYRIIQRFSNIIKGQFFGHAHTDYITVFYEDMHNISSNPIGVLYAAPSTTTFTGMNPAYRIYEINVTDHFKVDNIMNYFADLEKTTVDRPPKWKLLYSAKDEYDLNDLSPSSWNNLVNSVYNDRKSAERFFRNAVRMEDHMCDATCQWELLCALRMGHHNSTLYCPHKRFSNTSERNE
uniref:Metallophos domain-containing protein n=1 Tax=Angiostrongylus cantonensis TaxID=6313 RepID=A0A0K0DP58_ANGCA